MKKKISTIIFLLFIITVSCTTYQRNRDLEINSTLDHSAAFYNKKALALADSGMYTRAVATMYKAITIRPLDPELYLNLGSIYYYAGSPDSAIFNLRKAVRLRPVFPMAWTNMARIYLELGDMDNAMSAANRALEQNPDYTDAWVLKSEIYTQNHLFDEAIAVLQQRTKAEPNQAVYHQQLGYIYHLTGLLDNAMMEYQTSLSISPNNPHLLFNLGNVYFQQCLLEDASAAYKAALDLSPSQYESLNNYGMVLTYLGLYDDAQHILHNAIARNPESPIILFNLSIVSERSGRFNVANDYIDLAIENDSTQTLFYIHKGNIMRELGDPDQAMQAYEKALSMNENSIAAINNKSSILMDKGQVEKAKSGFEKTIQLYTQNANHLDLQSLDQPNENFELVIGWCSDPERIYTEYARLYNNLGKSQLLLNQPAQAVISFELAAEKDPKIPEIHSNLAAALQQTNEPERSVRELAYALLLQGDDRYKDDDIGPALLYYRDAVNTDPSWLLPKVKILLATSRLREIPSTDMEKAIAAEPENPHILVAAGEYYMYNDNPDRSELLFKQALSLKPNSIDILYKLQRLYSMVNETVNVRYYQSQIHHYYGRSYHFANLTDAAMVQYRLSLQSDSLNTVSALSLAELYLKKQLYTRSIGLFNHVLEIEPQNTDALLGLCTVFGNQQQYTKAIQYLEELLSMEPEHARGHYTLAVNYYFIKEFDKARTHILKAQSLGFNVNENLLSQLTQ